MNPLESAPKALRSGYGASDRLKNRTTTLIGAPTHERPQSIFTPPLLLGAVDEVWPEGIAQDPCWHPDSLVSATLKLTERGLDEPWADRTYVNPPFNELKKWLAKAFKEASSYSDREKEVMLLCPVQTHRQWWCDYAFTASAIAWLKPVKFVGYTQAFPVPLAMLYWGQRVTAFRTSFACLATRVIA